MLEILVLAEIADKEPTYELLLVFAICMVGVSFLFYLIHKRFSLVLLGLFSILALWEVFITIYPDDFDRMVISEVGRLEFALKSLLVPVAGLVANLILLSLSRKSPQTDTVNPCHS